MKWLKLYIWLLIIALFGTILDRAYYVVAVYAYSSGCSAASEKLGKDYGPEYKAYMNKFCDDQYNQIQQKFKLGD